MNNYEVLNILDKSWSKQKLIAKIKKGESSEKIVQDFINENKSNFDILINILNKTDNNILSYMEEIANCEINLINEIRNQRNTSNIEIPEKIHEINPIVKTYKEFQISLFIQKWSNQFVIGILIMLSIISLTKQAWA